MSTFNKLLKKDQHYLVLMVLLAIFIIFDVEIPGPIAEIVNTVVGKVIVVVVALSFCATNVSDESSILKFWIKKIDNKNITKAMVVKKVTFNLDKSSLNSFSQRS